MEHFLESKRPLIVILAMATMCSLWSPFFSFTREGVTHALIGTPKYWFDEGFVVEAARSLWELGRLDIAVEPGIVSGMPYYVSGGGFPVSVPLAGIFSVFGAGILQVRLLAVAWLLVAVAGIYLLWRQMFGAHAAFWGALLIATFAPFYANGKTITGEVPGFLFLIAALYMLYYKKRYLWGGTFAALALVTKPSIYILVAPALILEFALFERPFLRNTLRTALGALPVIALWLFIMLGNPFSAASWQGALSIYTNHYPLPSLFSQFSSVWQAFFSQSTVAYVLVLLILFVAALFWRRQAFTSHEKRVLWFIAFYGIIDIIYFFLSPGWLRYLLPLELFLLLMVYPILHALAGHPRRISPAPIIALLVLAQVVVFVWFSDIRSGLDTPRLADVIHERLGADNRATVGIVNAIQLAALISSERTFLVVDCGGGCTFGTHPLSVAPERLPQYLVVGKGDQHELFAYRNTLAEYYVMPPEEVFGSLIYTKH